MSFPLVSVLMTAHNREKYIAEAIESVLASSFKDFELIIVDDGSKDRTVEIARRYLADPRVQLHVNDKNLGDYPNRNRAAALARGKYLKYLDSDDIIYPYGLAVMVEIMEQFPEAAMAFDRPPLPQTPYPRLVTPHQAYLEHFLECGLLSAGPTGIILRADSFHAVGGFSGKRHVGDTELCLKLAACWPVVILPEGLVWWRIHDQQENVLGKTSNTETRLVFNYQISTDSLQSPSCPLDPAERQQALSSIKRRHAMSLLRLAVRKARPLAAWRLKRATGFGLADLARAFS